ncbi:MAG TPA: hypothetical protein VK386_10165 [Acidimicrobiales bacterium]|nr:hypothetical protein [Acidimicrobiales bacterium]
MDTLEILSTGKLDVVGQMPWSSNRTFLVTCRLGDEELAAVYKPARGERHLWDFPEGIYQREIAAFTLSELLGWHLVPETVERADAPVGPGSLQRFVDADFSQHHFTLVDDERHHRRLRTMCAFDIVANNADRKSGHCLLGCDGSIPDPDPDTHHYPWPLVRVGPADTDTASAAGVSGRGGRTARPTGRHRLRPSPTGRRRSQ